MQTYEEQDVLRLAKRFQNPKRSYLLVNPLQAKHIPVAPYRSTEMMRTLGRAVRELCPDPVCIIGFAETATAISTIAAMEFPDDTMYVQTTRECPEDISDYLDFREEHSHAPEQLLCLKKLRSLPAGTVLLVDDEISTGKTVLNIVRSLRRALPQMEHCDFIAVSVIGRVPQEKLADFAEEGIRFFSLVQPRPRDYEHDASMFTVSKPAVQLSERQGYRELPVSVPNGFAEGKTVGELRSEFEAFLDEAVSLLPEVHQRCRRLLLLGTEEYMASPLLLGERIAQENPACAVFCHATTRSPIGVLNAEDYPIVNGFCIDSFFEENRACFLYNLAQYDAALVVTDSRNPQRIDAGMQSLMAAFGDRCRQYILIRGAL